MASRSPSGPAAIICVGMAGSGKTTFMQRLNAHLHALKQPPYIMNLDPAVKNVPFDRNIDIRDSVDYKEVMKQYNLGPNGGIMTCLNLFATKVDQVVGILEQRAPTLTNVLIDTPGQIECFVWSASGTIITDAIASTFPTIIAYIIDTPRTTSPATFMANMLYACSILYKTKLPMILVFNKTDVQPHGFAHEWMTDFEAFQTALRKDEDTEALGGGGGSGYMGNLLNSMSLMLEEFYKHLSLVGVSAMTGMGVENFLDAVKEKVKEYETEYKPELEAAWQKRQAAKAEKQQRELDRLLKDMQVDPAGVQADVLSDFEDDDDSNAGEMVERDEDEPRREEDEDEDEEAGLQARYQKALAEDREKKGNMLDEDSFMRYLMANK
ncbi:hypothetical protein BDZ91DRAFT_774243 [Kalaharituber pfeilii]|nr:hypothetical protein BDZ91DRAFT_774243 [Kalaharituber pfeilii]